MPAIDLEQGLAEDNKPMGPQRGSSSVSSRPLNGNASHKSTARHDLEIFQTLVGINFLLPGGRHKPDSEQIHPASAIADIFFPSKAAQNRFRNRGLYDRAISLDMKNRLLYAITHYIISGLYILQILLTATFTAISGEASTSRIPLTVLGAISTVVAGMLAWLTGQGMPIRFRRARDQYREVVRAIERTERLFAGIEDINWPPGERPDPVRERDRLEKLFDDARLDQEANYPETHQSPTTNATAQQNEQLEIEIGRSKEQKDLLRNELEALKKELALFRPRSNSSKAPLVGSTEDE